MHYYDQAALDSIKLDELISKDPNYLSGDFPMDSTKERGTTNNRNRLEKGGKGLNSLMYRDPNEAKVHEKLEALQRVINTPVTASRTGRNYANSNGSVLHSEEVIKLEEMMQSMNTQDNEPDPELKQLSGMLESILDIQHPNRVQDKLRKASQAQRGQVFSIAATSEENPISSLNTKLRNQADSDERSKGNSFYSLEEPASTDFLKNAIAAVIHNTQTIVNGSTVKLRLVGAVFINGVQIPKNTFLFGLASLKGERLLVKINSIQYNNSLFPVDLNVFDLDGISGIYIPGAINRDVAKATADRSVQTLGVASLDDSWGAQAAGVGIEAAKTLLSKKAKLIKVVVKAGYQVLLHDEQQKQNNSNQN
jgi:conjugative transposon TraM protein